MPGGLSLLLFFPLAGRIADSVPAHIVIGTGLLSYMVAFTLLNGVDVNTPFWTFVFWTFFIRFQVGLHDAGGECDGLESSAGRNGQSSSSRSRSIRQLGRRHGALLHSWRPDSIP